LKAKDVVRVAMPRSTASRRRKAGKKVTGPLKRMADFETEMMPDSELRAPDRIEIDNTFEENPMQREILQLIRQGYTVEDIAEELEISTYEVRREIKAAERVAKRDYDDLRSAA